MTEAMGILHPNREGFMAENNTSGAVDGLTQMTIEAVQHGVEMFKACILGIFEGTANLAGKAWDGARNMAANAGSGIKNFGRGIAQSVTPSFQKQTSQNAQERGKAPSVAAPSAPERAQERATFASILGNAGFSAPKLEGPKIETVALSTSDRTPIDLAMNRAQPAMGFGIADVGMDYNFSPNATPNLAYGRGMGGLAIA